MSQFAMVPVEVIRAATNPDSPVKAEHVLLYAHLATKINGSSDTLPGVYPSQRTLAKELGVGIATVNRRIHVLLDAGLLTVIPQEQWLERWKPALEHRQNATVYGFPHHPVSKPARSRQSSTESARSNGRVVKDKRGRPSTRKRDIEREEHSKTRTMEKRERARRALHHYHRTGEKTPAMWGHASLNFALADMRREDLTDDVIEGLLKHVH